MVRAWRDFWEHHFLLRHGYPSQGARADLERQAAFLDDILAHATPETNMHMVRMLIEDYARVLEEYVRAETQTHSDVEAQNDFLRSVHELSRLHAIANAAGINVNNTLHQRSRRAYVNDDLQTNQEVGSGRIPSIARLRVYIDRAAEDIRRRLLEWSIENILRSRSGVPHGSSIALPLTRNFLAGCNRTPGWLQPTLPFPADMTRDVLPSYNDAIHGVLSDYRVPNNRFSGVQMTEESTQPAQNSVNSNFSTRSEPPQIPLDRPPEYENSQSSPTTRLRRRRQRVSRSSAEPTNISNTPGDGSDVSRGILQLSIHSVSDQGSRHTSQGAQRLGIVRQPSTSSLPAFRDRRQRRDFEQEMHFHCEISGHVPALSKKPSLRFRRASNTKSEIRRDDEYSTEYQTVSLPDWYTCAASLDATSSRDTEGDKIQDEQQRCWVRTSSSRISEEVNQRNGPQKHSWATSPSFGFENVARRSELSDSDCSLPFSWPDVTDPGTLPIWGSYAEALKGNIHSSSEEFMSIPSAWTEFGVQNTLHASNEETSKGKPLANEPEGKKYKFPKNVAQRAVGLRSREGSEDAQHAERKVICQRTPSGSSSSTGIGLSNKFRHKTDSAEYLSLAHSYKQREDVANLKYYRIMKRHEWEMQRIAAECWLPGDSHRREQNRFDVLSDHGDASLLEYSRHESSRSRGSESSLETEDDPNRLHLRGGAFFTPYEAANMPWGDLHSRYELEYALRFINSRGNEYFCDIDEDYLTDRFNLTSLNTEVQYYQYALDLITDVLDIDVDDDTREHIEKSARHLYGLVHARYIVTTRGLQKMSEKYKNGDFGKCPRVSCDGQPLLPMGQHDNANMSAVKLYCARCEDLYNPKSSRHASVDGAYFGSSFHNMFFQVYPNLMPPKSQRRYEPKIFGFKVHGPATLARWQGAKREDVKDMLKAEGLETGFEEEERQEDMDASEDDEDGGQDGIDDMFEGQRALH